MEDARAAIFAEQVTLNSLVQNVVVSCAVCEFTFKRRFDERKPMPLFLQLAGIVVRIGAAAATAPFTALILKATNALTVSGTDMAEGRDVVRWGIGTDVLTKEDLIRA